MKSCLQCNVEKPLEDFHKAKKGRLGRHSYCKTCKNGNDIIIKKQKRNFIQRYKMLCGCARCGYKANPVALQFDHIDPATKRHQHKGVSTGWTMEGIKTEIRKCQVLCANCHSIKTFEERE